MKLLKTTPFKAPRNAVVPLLPPRRTGHRKDNAEWGKRMERELGQIEKRRELEQNKVTTQKVPRHVKTTSDKQADEMSRQEELERGGSDSEGDELPIAKTLQTEPDSLISTNNSVQHLEAVGTKVAKEFGSLGVYFGSVLSKEYDSDDDDRAKPFYCVKYTDGDTEDLNESEFGFARELCIQMELDAEDDVEDEAVSSGTDEDESYRPSPKVCNMPYSSFI
jgi:hypothetical protein